MTVPDAGQGRAALDGDPKPTPAGGAAPPDRQQPLLEVRELKAWFHTDRGVVRAVDGVDFAISTVKLRPH